ncbi:MAG TPA: winged helix-turn-helix domain-containing protein [Anaerolinea sp.]|nr:winged helix-turn-helix domain-containing protein [Anaerolinea sp.]
MKPKFNQTTHMIEDLATLQVIAEPLRAQIFEVLANDMLTVRQVSERLGLTPSRLYYHINLLEQHGLIQVVETRTVMNMIEKVYQAVAPNLEVADALLEFTSPETRQQTVNMITSIVDASLR